MRSKATLLAGVVLAASSLAASANVLVSQGVTFTTEAVDADTMTLRIQNILNATGNWAPVQFFGGFDLRDIGTFTGGTVTYTGGFDPGEIGQQITGASGGADCANGGGSGAICFDLNPNVALTNDMLFTIDFTGGPLDFNAPHLKVGFLVNSTDTSPTGDLLSQTIPVPAPIVGAGLPGLVIACGGLLALARRRRKAADA